MNIVANIIRPLLVCLTVLLLGSGFVDAAEIDDAAVFVDAFATYQKKDYLLTMEKVEQLNRLFPDSALRDVVLLLAARSSYKAGDNERAAKTITSFLDEFPESGLKVTIEEELLTLSRRQQKGEKLSPNKQLQSAAQKVRSERLAQEQLAAVKLEQERLAKERNERERIAREKAEAERRAMELAAAEKAAKESIKIVITMQDDGAVTEVGESGRLPVEISNRGNKNEEFLLEIVAPTEYGVLVVPASKSAETVTRIKLAAGETFRGNLVFRMPNDRIDGSRTSLTVKATSAVYSDVIQQKSTVVIASAPLVRVVAKLSRLPVNSVEQLRYKVSILNIGSMAAQMLTVRILLPDQLDFQGVSDMKFRKDPDGGLVFSVERIDIGKLAEIQMDVKMRENSSTGKKLQNPIEVVNGQLQRKDNFTVNVAALQANPKP